MADKIETIHVIDENGHPTRVFKITSEIRLEYISRPPEALDGDVAYQLGDGTGLRKVEGGFEIPGGGGRFTLA